MSVPFDDVPEVMSATLDLRLADGRTIRFEIPKARWEFDGEADSEPTGLDELPWVVINRRLLRHARPRTPVMSAAHLAAFLVAGWASGGLVLLAALWLYAARAGRSFPQADRVFAFVTWPHVALMVALDGRAAFFDMLDEDREPSR